MKLAPGQIEVPGVMLGGSEHRHADDAAFLPAALEILETPPSPTGRALAAIIIAFFVLAVAWALLGKVDIFATAIGRLVPAGKVKIVQSLDAGRVRAITVQDGDHVLAGQVLIELDPTDTGADRDRLSHDLVSAELDVARLRALKHAIDGHRAPHAIDVPAGATARDVEMANAAMRAQADGQAEKLAALQQQISQKQAESAEVTAEIGKLNGILPLAEEKRNRRQILRDKGYGTSFAFIDAEQQVSETRNEIAVQMQRAAAVRAGRAALEQQRNEEGSRYASDILEQLSKAEQRRNELSGESIKAERKSGDTKLRSPIDGVVEQLAVHSIGGVISPAQRLLNVVPDNQNLFVEALVPNRDVGFIHPGQRAEIKVETFNFTRYGLLHGEVVSVARDSAPAGAREPLDPQATDSATVPGSPSYSVRIRLDRNTMVVDGHARPLVPGMAVTAEIVTGRRTIMDYLLSPLARRASESLHER